MNDTQYTGMSGKVYCLSGHIKKGGEGAVYHLKGIDGCVGKIFNNKKSAEEKSALAEKLKLMVKMKVNPYLDGVLVLAWPQDVLYDSAGRFAGYVMPFASERKSLVVACRASERAGMLYGSDYTWKKSIATAYNLALLTDCLHEGGIVIGDFNANNTLVNCHAQVTLIDCDSFQFQVRTGKGCTLYKCTVGLPETQAPEVQGRDMRKPGNDYTIYTDRFALAIHIFMLLCNGFHPFNVMKSASGQSVTGGSDIQSLNIQRGYCPFVKKHVRSDLPQGSPNMEMLPDYIMELFRRAFDYDASTAVLNETIRNRPSAMEWKEALQRLFDECEQQCSKDPQHVYWSGYDKCPWCEINGIRTYKRSAFPFFLVCLLVGAIYSPLMLELINYLFGCGYNIKMLLEHGMIIGAFCGLITALFWRKDYIRTSKPARRYWISAIAPLYSVIYFLIQGL